ncbi:hypothetical protein J4422_00210 [Candidatus Pacearchaeota archaeon]|nr:hypothetical protein [Candidatus Pacearchaeota archaeon]
MKETDEFIPNTDLGQHFLIDKKVIDKEIAIADLSKEDMVIEIGAGKGYLTEQLALKSKEVLAFELDPRMNVFLDALEKKHKNLRVVYGDAMKFSWKGYDKIVSNIPYFLAEPLIKKAIESSIEEMILIVGENFKGTITENKSKAGITVNLFFDFTPIAIVKKTSFSPEPRVDSWLITLKQKTKVSKEERILQSIILKKGKIKNAIINSLTFESGLTKKQAKNLLEQMHIENYVLNKPVASITGRFLEKVRDGLKELA